MNTVPDKLTPLLITDALWSVRDGLRQILGREPSSATVAVLAAQAALETGRWQLIHRFNWGNIKAGDDYPGDVCFFRCNEVIGGKLQWFDPPHPQTRFRAFDTAAEGCEAWLTFVASLRRYAGAWQAALTGDPSAYVHALKLGGYFTANESLYLRGVRSLFAEFLGKLTLQPRTTDAPPVDHEAALSALHPERWGDIAADVYQWREAHGMDVASGLDLSHSGKDTEDGPQE